MCKFNKVFRIILTLSYREQIFKQSTELVCRAYGEVYKGVTNPANAYKDAESVLHRTPQQVQTLLSWNVPHTPYKLWQATIWLPHSVFWDWHWILATRPYSNNRLVMGRGLSLLIVNYVKQRHSSDNEYIQKNDLSWFLKCCSADAAVCQRRGQLTLRKKYYFFLPMWMEISTSRPREANYRPFHCHIQIHMHWNIHTVITLHTQGLFRSLPQWPDMTQRQSVIRNSSVFLLFKTFFFFKLH